MGQRIDDEIREQELKQQAKKAAHIEKILTPEGFAEAVGKFENEIKEKVSFWLADVNEPIWKEIGKLQERVTKLETLTAGYEELDDRIRELIRRADVARVGHSEGFKGPSKGSVQHLGEASAIEKMLDDEAKERRRKKAAFYPTMEDRYSIEEPPEDPDRRT